MTQHRNLARQTRWVARNFAFNLDFVPADKWDWKPAPTANSAQEITGHITQTLHRAALIMAGATWDEAEAQMPSAFIASLESAKSALQNAAEAFAAQLETLSPAMGAQMLNTPYGEFTIAQFADVDFFDLVHHHGQIAYIQTLLGDTESHFVDGDF